MSTIPSRPQAEAPRALAVALAAIAEILPEGGPPELDYLRAGAAVHTEPWRDAMARLAHAPHPGDAPLAAAAGGLSLCPEEVLAIALAAAVEEDTALGRALARAQAPIGGSRPTLGLLAAACGGPTLIHTILTGAALASGVLILDAEGAPLGERAAAVLPHICLALSGRDLVPPGTRLTRGGVELAASTAAAAVRNGTGLRRDRALVVRCGSAEEGQAAAAAVAAAAGRRALLVEADHVAGLGPWLLLRDAVPIFSLELAPGERRRIAEPLGYDGPLIIVCGREGSVEVPGRSTLTWAVPIPSAAERRALWAGAIGDGELAQQAAHHHRCGAERVATLGRLAAYHAALAGREQPAADDLAAATRGGDELGMDGVAQHLPEPIPDEALVAGEVLRAELDLLALRCRERERLGEGLGPSAQARYTPGVRALFVGPSGTGKTLAAGWLATRLGVPLFRVDLASVTSKYIGETEKNLAQLMARSEHAGVMLLFDEADSLFGKRTEVRDSNDRFANAQTNYLLQRIESFDGVAILTSNSSGRFDPAFARRFDAVVEFPLPSPEERLELWRAHLGGQHSLSPRQLNTLAASVDLSGGHLRNAVLTAAVLARGGSRPIGYAEVLRGVTLEYRKIGRPMPGGLERVV